jgi:L-fuculose-phosphate aldolase
VGRAVNGSSSPDEALRASLVSGCRELARRGLIHGTSGNISVRRDRRGFFVSPSGLDYAAIDSGDIPLVSFDGRWFGRRRPSSEWRFHRDILAMRDDIHAVVHTHSPRATALACTGRGIPAFHYMVAIAGGDDIRCSPYHVFGSQELSDAALQALQGRRACLLANHGVIALGTHIAGALALAGEVEDLAEKYCTALALGDVRILDESEMRKVVEKFRTYGKDDAVDPGLTFGAEGLPPLPDPATGGG